MAADVSYLSRIFNGSGGGGGGETTDSGEPIATRDFLGMNFNSSVLDCTKEKELDLDLHVPIGFEKRLDLKTGNIYIQKSRSAKSSKSAETKVNDTVSRLQDLNFPTTDETALDLKLLPATASVTPAISSTTTAYSVCTLDKVKSALERLEKKPNKIKRRSASMCSPSTQSHSSSSVKVGRGELIEEEDKSAYAGGCPNCLLYVLVSKKDPKCPRCNVTVPSPTAFKKPRIDLNISL